MSLGVVKWFNDCKGYGFIKNENGEDVFVHYSVIFGDGYKSLREGDLVDYEYQKGPKGLLATTVKRNSNVGIVQLNS